MEFDSKLAVIQAVLRNQRKLHGDLLSIGEESEREIIAINSKLLEAVIEESMTKDDLRRVYLLLLLNTDLDCFEDLHNDPNYVHIMGSNPEISKLLFIKIVNHLKLDEFLYESVVFLPPVISAEIIEIYLILLKTRDPFLMLKHVDFIARASFSKLVLLNDSGGDNIFEVKLKYFEYLQLIMENFSSSKIDDYKSWEQNKLYYFSACIMKAMTSIVKTCCGYFLQPIIKKESCHDIYNIDIKKEFNKKVKIETKITENDLMKDCLQVILSKFFLTAQSITILTWMAWLELEEYTEENLQLVIGNEVYSCLSFIKDEKIKTCINSHLHSELINVLTSLSIKPTNEDDHIKSADIQTILSSINDPTKNHEKWLYALVSHEDFIPDLAKLNIINEKVHLLNQNTCLLLLDRFVENSLKDVSDNCENETKENKNDLFKQIILTSLKNFHVDNQIIVLESFMNKYGLRDFLKLPGFETQITEIFNKVINEEDNQTMDFYSDLINVTFQSPQAVVKKILKESLYSTQHGKLMVNLLKVIKPVCFFKPNDTSSSTLYTIVNEMMITMDWLSDTEIENFVVLITRLINKSLIDGNEFLIGCLMPHLYESIKLQKWSLVILLLDLLKSYTSGLVKIEDCELKLPVHLVFLCQLMDKTRCTLSNYSGQCSAVYDKALEVLTSVLEFFEEEEEQIGSMQWIQNEMQKLNVITQLHVISHINSPLFTEAISKTSIEVYWLKLILCGIDTDVSFLFDMRRDLFVRTLTKLLPGFSIREWKIMFTGLVPKEEIESLHELFLAASDAVLLLEAAVIPHIDELNIDDLDSKESNSLDKSQNASSSSATACLCFIIRNLITIVQDIIFPHVKKMSKENLSEIFLKICKILHEFPQAASNTSWIVLKVLQDLISFAELPKIHKRGESYVEVNKFCAGIGLLQNIDLRQNLSKAIMTSVVKCTETVV